MGVPKLCAAKCNTALICSRVTENSSMTSSTVKPASKFSNTVATGIRVSLNTHAPLTLPGTLSTAGHWDQSRVVMCVSSFHRSVYHGSASASRHSGEQFLQIQPLHCGHVYVFERETFLQFAGLTGIPQ